MKIKDAKWEMTDDYIGMKPKFKVVCSDCMWNDLMEMIAFEMDFQIDVVTSAWVKMMHRFKAGQYDMPLREMHCTKLPTISDKAHANNMHYKCCKLKGCDRVKVFGVPIDKEYYNELVKRRGGKERVQPRDQWDEEEDLKKQLESMGYL